MQTTEDLRFFNDADTMRLADFYSKNKLILIDITAFRIVFMQESCINYRKKEATCRIKS